MRAFSFVKLCPSRTCLWRAFVICAISLSMIKISEAQTVLCRWRHGWLISEGVSDWFYIPAEPSDVQLRIWKSVIVKSPSPQVQKFSSCLNISDVLSSYGTPSRSYSTRLCLLRSNESCTGLRVHASEIEAARQRCVSQFAGSINSQVLCRSVATVSPVWPKAPRVDPIGVRWIPKREYPRRSQESAFISNQSFSSEHGM